MPASSPASPPQASPTLTCQCPDQRIFFIFYHDIRDLIFEVVDGSHYVQFAHQSVAVTIKGKSLRYLATMIGEGKLKAVYEPNGMPLAASHTSPTAITAIRATLLGQAGRGEKVVGIGARGDAAAKTA